MGLNLSQKDKEFLAGKHGSAAKMAMEVLVELAIIYEAKNFIDITQAHIDGSSYAAAREVGLDFAEEIASAGGFVRVPTTLNITARDINRWKEFRIPESFVEKSSRMEQAYLKMGCIPTWTCAPYHYGVVPRFGEQVVWAESNAIAFVNSVIGARTARYGDFIDICAAITGRAPNMEYHLTEKRKGEILLDFQGLKENSDYSSAFYAAIGHLAGELAVNMVPVLRGIPKDVTPDKLKALSAAAASSGSIGLFHILGVTPEAQTFEAAFQGDKPVCQKTVGVEDIKKRWEILNSCKEDKFDLVAVGCPHYSYPEVLEVLKIFDGRKVSPGVEFWVHTNQTVEYWLKSAGIWDQIRDLGVRIITDTCILNWPLEGWDFKVLMTDSGKFAHYAPSHTGMDVIFASLKECVEGAVRGFARRESNEL